MGAGGAGAAAGGQTVRCRREEATAPRFGRRPPKAQVAALEGFNLHASVVIGAKDREGRERLLRYVARPAMVNERVTELPDGRVASRLKPPGGGGETHRIMEPMEFMAGTAALVPPPRHPLVRYQGVFAPNSPWRGAVIPAAPPAERGCSAHGATSRGEEGRSLPPAVPTRPEKREPQGGDVFGVPEGVRPRRAGSVATCGASPR